MGMGMSQEGTEPIKKMPSWAENDQNSFSMGPSERPYEIHYR